MRVLTLALVLLHGVVMQGPTKPVCQVGVPCSKPAVNLQLVFTRTNGAVIKVRTGAKGGYSVKLPPGIYTVSLLPPRTIGRGISPRKFTAHGATQRLDFDVDTGIR